jgi:hypothetical protein
MGHSQADIERAEREKKVGRPSSDIAPSAYFIDSFAYADAALAFTQTIMLTPLQQCQSAIETASINTNGSQDDGIEIPGWDRPQGRESQRQGPYGKAHAGATRGSR